MEKTIKYLENGEYHYATVRAVGDLAKLKTDSKEDLVAAINDLFDNGGQNAGKPDGYDKLVEQVADSIKNQQDLSKEIDSAQKELNEKIDSNTSTATDLNKQAEEIRQDIEAMRQDAIQQQKLLDEQVNKLKAASQDLDKKTADLANDIEAKFSSAQNDYKTVSENLNNETATLHKQLGDVKREAEQTRSQLQDQAGDIGNIHKSVDDLSEKVSQKIWMSDLDPVKQQVTKNSTEVQQTKDQLLTKADQSDLDLVSNSVEKLDTEVKKNAKGLEVAVRRDELAGNVSELLRDKANLLLGTRAFSGNSWVNKDKYTVESGYYKGVKVLSTTEKDSGIYQPYDIKAKTPYTFSFYAKQSEDNLNAKLLIQAIDNNSVVINNPEQTIHVSTEWQRFAVTFNSDSDCKISIQIKQGETSASNRIYLAGFMLQYGASDTSWEPNEADVADNIERNESKFNVFSDKIEGVVKKQEQFGSSQTELETKVTQNAEGLKQASHQLEDANGKINKFQGDLESTAKGLKASYEEYTNKAIGQISDSSLNLIRNGSFSNNDSDFDQWQNVSAKVNIREDENGLRWVELTQSGMTTDNPQGITSNYFVIKQGKVTVAVDIKLGDKANLDNQNILLLELYNDNKQRVDFTDVSVSQLGLSTAILNDHNVHRGLYRLGIDRKDVKYMTVKALLVRNGDLYFTNFSAKLSSIDDGAYIPNPDDVNNQILKMNTKIEEDAQHIALKANSVDVTRDIKSAVDGVQVGGTNLLRGTSSEAISGDAPTTGWKDMGSIYNTSGPLNEKQYVLSFDARGDVDKQIIQTFLWPERLGGNNIVTSSVTSQGDKYYSADGNSYFTLTTQWTRYWVIYNVSPDNMREQVIVGRRQAQASGKTASGKVYIKSVKLEEGNKSTSWSPAPEDTSAEIKSAKDAAIKVASDQINIRVNELSTQFDDKLNKRVNEVKTASEKFTSDGIEQVVTKVANVKNDVDRLGDTVGNLEVGGRNLLIGTSEDEKSGKAYAFADYQISGGLQPNKTYTLSGWARVDQDSLNHHQNVFIDAYSEDWSWSVSLNINSSLTAQYNKITFTTPNGKQLHPSVTVYLSHPDAGTNENNNDAISGTAFIKKLKLEEGNIATDYTHAPEDINQSIKDATEYKTVTGTIDFNNLKTQQKIFYKDSQATNAPAGGSYWYYLNVEPGYDDRILQTAVSDRDNITWVRTFVDNWGPWIRQADQRNVDDLNNQISSFKTETTASVKNLGDRVTTEVNSVTKKINSNNGGGVNLLTRSSFRNMTLEEIKKSWSVTPYAWVKDKKSIVIDFKNGTGQNATADIIQTVNLEPDTDYTLSLQLLYAEVASGKSWGFQTFLVEQDENGKAVSPYKDNGLMMQNSKSRAANTRLIHTSEATYKGVLYISALPGTQVEFKDVKLERGNIATPWSDSPEDLTNAISEVNTKWDVANGQIQGKVTATDVNNILNGKGYATQSWAQTMFTMKSDAITLQAVRDNITNGIQNQVNDTRNQVEGLQNQFNTQTGINLLKGTADFSGPWFNKNGKGWSYSGEWQPPTSENKSERNNNVVYQDSGHAWDGLGQTVELDTGEYTFSMWMWPTLSGNESMNIYAGDSQYGGTAKVNYSGYRYSASQPQNRWILVKTYLTVTQGGKLSIRPELNQASGTIHVASYMLQHGHVENPVWAPAPDDLAPKSIISSINITPDQIKIASNKIVIDGNTDIHGVLRVPEVKLQGNSGYVDLSGDGIHIGGPDGDIKLDSGGIDITKNGQGLSITGDYIQVVTDSNGQKEITGLIGSSFNLKNKNQNGLALLVTPQQELGRPYGGDLLTIGELDKGGEVTSAVTFDATNITGDGSGFHWTAPHYLHGPAQAIHIENTQDNLTLLTLKMPHSSQEGYYQPALTVTHGVDGNGNYVHGDSGVEFFWNSIKPYGSVDMTDARLWVYGVDHGIKNVWVSWSGWDGGERYPALVNDIGYWGGIAFPKSGRVTLFDADGRYYTPDRNTGIGAYDNYMSKNNNWH